MADLRDKGRESEVHADHSTLRATPNGTHTHTQYTISLRGLVDGLWFEAFVITQAESSGYRHFRLDRANGAISFACRTVDGTVQVFDTLELLEALIGAVNLRVGGWRTQVMAPESIPRPRGVA